MFDAYKIKYRLLLVDEAGVQRNVKEYAGSLGWEENPKQLATKISFTVFEKTADSRISQMAKPGTLVIITAEIGSRKEEVARGHITSWEPTKSNQKDEFKITAYDELFNLMKSQDNVYYSAGTGTKTIINDLAGKWGIPIASYNGPNATHDKLAYSTKNIAEIIYDVLDDAAKKGGVHAILRAVKGKINVVKWGSNSEVWCFDVMNSESETYKISTESMITRVKVMGEQNDDGRTPVEAVLDGKTSFGIRQKIYRRGKDESVADAKAAAQDILNEEGDPEETIIVKSPDVPFIRKGDKVRVKINYADGFFFVKGVKHDASTCSMTMTLTNKESEK